jgi:hypothetical protein
MQRPKAGAAAFAVLAIAALAMLVASRSGSCNDKNGAGGSASGSASAEASDAAAHTVRVRPGCHPTMVGGTLAKVRPGALSLAVVKDRALLVGTVQLEPHGWRGAQAERIVLDRMGAPVGSVETVADALPVVPGVTTFAAALAEDGRLTTLTYAARRPTATECTDGLLVSKVSEVGELHVAADAAANATDHSVDAGAPRRELLTHACRSSSMLVAAARGPLGIAFLDGATTADGDPKTAPAIADAVVIAGLSSFQVRLETISGGATIANAATAAGATSVAAAYVVAHDTTRELHVVQLGSNGKLATKVEVFDKQNVGTVTVAYEGDTLHVMWSSFVPEKKRFVLRWSKWLAGAAPTATQSIGTGVLSAVTPSLAIDRGRFLLAWANEDEKASTVKVGASVNGIVAIAGLASVVSTPSSVAREPVVALDGDTMFVAWKELAGAEPEVHAASISCRE